VFRNLYFLVSSFRDFNFCDFLDYLEEVPESYLRVQIAGEYDGEPVEPYFEPIIPLTLHPDACAAFFRSHPHVPASERDYYLSKAFQFVWLPLEIRFGLSSWRDFEPRDRIEVALDQAPDEELPNLWRIEPWDFLDLGRSGTLEEILGELPSFLAGARSKPPAGKKSGRGRKPDIENHLKLLRVIEPFGDEWRRDEDALCEAATAADRQGIPVPTRWAYGDPPARSWERGVEVDRERAIKAIEYRLQQAYKHKSGG